MRLGLLVVAIIVSVPLIQWGRASAAAPQDQQAAGRAGWPCAGRPDPTFVKTAEGSGGQLFMFHPSEVGDSGALMAASFSHRETLFRVAGALPAGLHEYAITIDPSIESVLFSLSVQCLQVVEIERPSGDALQASDEGVDYHQFEAGRVVVLRSPEPGTWTVRASGRGLFFLVVQAKSPLALGRVQLLRKDGRGDLVPTFDPAVRGTRQVVAIAVDGADGDVAARLVSATWAPLGEVSRIPTTMPDAARTSPGDAPGSEAAPESPSDEKGGAWTGQFVVPPVPYRIVVSGRGPDGRPFDRVHAPLFGVAGG